MSIDEVSLGVKRKGKPRFRRVPNFRRRERSCAQKGEAAMGAIFRDALFGERISYFIAKDIGVSHDFFESNAVQTAERSVALLRQGNQLLVCIGKRVSQNLTERIFGVSVDCCI